jgi:hypothetical protein
LPRAVAKLSSQPKTLAWASHLGIPWAHYRLIGVAELAATAGQFGQLTDARRVVPDGGLPA